MTLIQQFLEFDGLSGVTLDYSKEWAELAMLLKIGAGSQIQDDEERKDDEERTQSTTQTTTTTTATTANTTR